MLLKSFKLIFKQTASVAARKHEQNVLKLSHKFTCGNFKSEVNVVNNKIYLIYINIFIYIIYII